MKRKNKYKILFFLLVLAGTISCERDDICAETTSTTPHLNIRFYDINAPEDLKAVRALTVRALDSDGSYLDDIELSSPLDSIALPLRTIEGLITTRFALERDTDFRLDTIAATESNVDIITISYRPQYVYVSRACGYKSIFTDLFITVEPDDNNWILTNEILTTTIENENQAHLIFRH